MTDRELMQQALEALEYPGPSWPEARHKAAVALRERLAQPQRTHWEGCEEVHPECRQPEQEPVAVVALDTSRPFVSASYNGQVAPWTQAPEVKTVLMFKDLPLSTPLYTTPPRREWVGLTEEEADELVERFARYELLHAIEAKLREKNV